MKKLLAILLLLSFLYLPAYGGKNTSQSREAVCKAKGIAALLGAKYHFKNESCDKCNLLPIQIAMSDETTLRIFTHAEKAGFSAEKAVKVCLKVCKTGSYKGFKLKTLKEAESVIQIGTAACMTRN